MVLLPALTSWRWAADLLATDERASAIAEGPDEPVPVGDATGADDLVRRHRLELLRLGARDLAGVDDLRATTAGLSAAADGVLHAALRLSGVDGIAVIGMGKLGAGELNYASDLDLVLVGGDAEVDERALRAGLAMARRCIRIDLNLRPEGRDGALVRTVDGFIAHWERWASPWERQALLKVRPIAGDPAIGRAYTDAAHAAVWAKPFGRDAIRSVRKLKARAEADVATRGATELDVKRGRGGIRDAEFAVQLLQLVHGGADPALRAPATLDAVAELAAGGYVDAADAQALDDAYRHLRLVEHRLQLPDLQPTHTLPTDLDAVDQLARSLGERSTAAVSAADAFLERHRRHRAAVREIHERLWFRPLLEAFTGVGGPLPPEAVETRLAAFGFSDLERTQEAVGELTRGLTRTSRLMQQLLPLLLDWLSQTPDPDVGLLGLRTLATGNRRAGALAEAFRDSPEVARRLCTVLGTSALLGRLLERDPDLVPLLVDPVWLTPPPAAELRASAGEAAGWRDDPDERRLALKRWADRQGLRIGAADVLGEITTDGVSSALTDLAETVVDVAVPTVAAGVPLAVVAMGRFGGGELSYPSDLDLVFAVADGVDPEEAERAASRVLRFLGGGIPHLYDVDPDLRPEGRHGPLVRSLESWHTYVERWAEPWERLAWVRARAVAGDAAVGAELVDAVLGPWVWDRPVAEEERRELRRIKARVETERLPAGDDPDFHLKLGRGGLLDIEFCVQLLQLVHGVRATGTAPALEGLLAAGALSEDEHAVLSEAHSMLETTRNRLFLVTGTAGDSLPAVPEQLAKLAVSLGTTPGALRETYRRVTRRARRVVEHRFYGLGNSTSEPIGR